MTIELHNSDFGCSISDLEKFDDLETKKEGLMPPNKSEIEHPNLEIKN
jgi:hypothetical protein